MTDKPQFRIEFIVHKDEVLMLFQEPYKFVSLPPAMAREVAANLIKMADEIEKNAP